MPYFIGYPLGENDNMTCHCIFINGQAWYILKRINSDASIDAEMRNARDFVNNEYPSFDGNKVAIKFVNTLVLPENENDDESEKARNEYKRSTLSGELSTFSDSSSSSSGNDISYSFEEESQKIPLPLPPNEKNEFSDDDELMEEFKEIFKMLDSMDHDKNNLMSCFYEQLGYEGFELFKALSKRYFDDDEKKSRLGWNRFHRSQLTHSASKIFK